ncbi:acyltransferase family protein [Sphingobacterium hungaricum]|uniref:Acyltransferase n=1 Tax=Sphingobacterium hungaricum TaxID=2082723 RepID=A0A928V278_9SPHI|nr:acyltransferase [Sphingobacterium hungaricum]MBE8715172.1 acyltransferase [Sphingobacterium hungaricum]
MSSKKHFVVLDGLRGVAALAVLIFHFAEIIFPDLADNFIAHGFLAVDFFFCLSGVVIAYAYQNRIANMGIGDFLVGRLIRLHPLVVLGSLLGLFAFLFDPIASYQASYSFGEKFVIFMASILMIPYPVMEERYFNLFSLNAPAWSLFWEYVINIFYVLVLFRLSRYSLMALLLIASGILAYVSYSSGNLLGGWNGETFWHGGARVLYSFTAGMILFRFNWIIQNKLGFIGLSVLLVLAFILPYNEWSWATELLIVLFYFPLLVSLGAGTLISQSLKSICEFSGNISYPLYTTHYCVMWLFGGYYASYAPSGITLIGVVVIGVILLISLAYFAFRFYDLPLRKYLNAKRSV